MRAAIPLMALSLAFVAGGWAQDKKALDTPEIIQRREELLRNLQRASVPIYQAYLQSFEALRAQYTRERRTDALEALEAEIARVRRELDAATNAATRSNATTLQTAILSVLYGDHAKRKTVDITERLRKAMREGQAAVTLNTRDGSAGNDPAPFTKKETVITYTVNGQRKQKTFAEGTVLNFKDDLK